MRQTLAASIGALVKLEEQWAESLTTLEEPMSARVYEWRPSSKRELPAVWNWIDDGTYEIVDVARADDLLVVRTTIGVKPSDLAESMGKLLRLTDQFRAVVDPALHEHSPLEGTARYAKRVSTQSEIELFDGIPVMCLSMLIRLDLAASIA